MIDPYLTAKCDGDNCTKEVKLLYSDWRWWLKKEGWEPLFTIDEELVVQKGDIKCAYRTFCPSCWQDRNFKSQIYT